MSAPPPTTATDIQELVLADMRERYALGIQRYGTGLKADNGRDMLWDLYEELLDACCYIRGEIERRDQSALEGGRAMSSWFSDVLVRGDVELTGGTNADVYVDMKRATMSGLHAPAIGAAMLDMVTDWQFDTVGGLTLGADPVAAAMLHTSQEIPRLDMFVVRKTAKAHGTQQRIEGSVAGRRCLVVEDVVTSGRSALDAVKALNEAGAAVVGVAVVVDREAGARELMRDAGLRFRALHTLTEVVTAVAA